MPVTSGSSLPSVDTKAAIQSSQSVLSPEPLSPAVVPNGSASQASINTLDAQSDLTSARTTRLAEEVDDEDNEEENGLTDVQLRRLYDDEEIERFLAVFAAVRLACAFSSSVLIYTLFQHVTEVTLAPSVANAKPKKATVLRPVVEEGGTDDKILAVEDDSDVETDVDEPWTYLKSTETPSIPNRLTTAPEPSQQPHPHRPPRYLSARVAAWIIPKLPPTPVSPPSKFKISAARLAGQRLYVATYPVYAPFIADLIQLAAWADRNRSARICTAWWLFWLFDLLLPALLGKILFSLLRRRLLPYPNLNELRQRRRLAREADELSDAMEGHGAATSFLGTGPMPGIGAGGGDMGLRDMWKLTKIVTKGKSKKGKEKVKEAGDAVAEQVGLSSDTDEEVQNKVDEDWRRVTLKVLEEIADFHERVRK